MTIAEVNRVRLIKSDVMASLLVLTMHQVLDREGIQEADRVKAVPVIGLAQVPLAKHQEVLEPQDSQEVLEPQDSQVAPEPQKVQEPRET